MTRLNPPAGFARRDWSEEINSDELASKSLLEPNEAVLIEELLLRGPVPIPVSVDGGRTMDWSRSVEGESSYRDSPYLNPAIHCE